MDETATATETPAQSGSETSAASKILDIARGSFEKVRQVVRPGRGRPRSDGTPKKSDKVEFVPATESKTGLDGPAPFTEASGSTGISLSALLGPEFIKTCVRGFVKGFWAVPEAIIRAIADKRGISETEMDKKIARVVPLAEEIDALAVVLPVLAKKYGWDFENSPEGIALAIVSLQTARYGSLAIQVVKTPVPAPSNVTELKPVA